jgi:hypothetical protein
MVVKLVLISMEINANKYGWLRLFVNEINVNLKIDFKEFLKKNYPCTLEAFSYTLFHITSF